MNRFYYSKDISSFLQEANASILGKLVNCHGFKLEEQQRNAWNAQIVYLKDWLDGIPGHILFEYCIPRMGKRVDCVIISGSGIFVVEFKVGENRYKKSYENQLLDYALDLKNFHKESHHLSIIPVLVCTNAEDRDFSFEFFDDGLAKPIYSSGKNLEGLIRQYNDLYPNTGIDANKWIQSEYHPTPTIIEAAQALYQGHEVNEISRSDAGAYNLSRTSEAITEIIEYSRANDCKSICFLTGVPGAGKTLAGLNLANQLHDVSRTDHAVFLSGNGPLVEVLREALSRDDVMQNRQLGRKIPKSCSEAKTRTFVQNIHHFRDEGLRSEKPPLERVVVFDEAQRAWTHEQTARFMKRKKGIDSFSMSEPEFLIRYLDRHEGWATIICLIGGGQEINKGEAGIKEWFEAIKRSFPHWSLFLSSKLSDSEFGGRLNRLNTEVIGKVTYNDSLHLSVCVRSFRSERVSDFVKAVLDLDLEKARSLCVELVVRYPIVITRCINRAKAWVKEKARGSERFGLLASSGGCRLRPEGINVKAKIQPKHWFLNDSSDVRSSYFMEEVATEFDIQGLELDWALVSWDADLRLTNSGWVYKSFKGTKWEEIRKPTDREYLKNAYRVLLTRARQGMVIFIPQGNHEDKTRLPEFYNETFLYLRSIGIKEI